MKRFPFYRQMDAMDCGPSCLRMVAKYYGKAYPLQYLREACHIDREGVSLKGISEAAGQIGFQTMAIKVPYGEGKGEPSLLEATLPVIAHWNQNHFIVVYKVNKRFTWIADPGAGRFKLRREVFEKHWASDNKSGIFLLLAPGGDFFKKEYPGQEDAGFSFLFNYLKPYRRLILQLALGVVMGSVFSLLFPFLTQAIVDVGIQNQNIGFIYLVLMGQLVLFLSQMTVNFIQNWILLHVGTRMNISLIGDFLLKIMRLPIGFFDTRMTGDLMLYPVGFFLSQEAKRN